MEQLTASARSGGALAPLQARRVSQENCLCSPSTRTDLGESSPGRSPLTERSRAPAGARGGRVGSAGEPKNRRDLLCQNWARATSTPSLARGDRGAIYFASKRQQEKDGASRVYFGRAQRTESGNQPPGGWR